MPCFGVLTTLSNCSSQPRQPSERRGITIAVTHDAYRSSFLETPFLRVLQNVLLQYDSGRRAEQKQPIHIQEVYTHVWYGSLKTGFKKMLQVPGPPGSERDWNATQDAETGPGILNNRAASQKQPQKVPK